jgi:DNA-binding NtrC family response regulator
MVLLDVLMPGLDGPHTLARLQKLSPAVRCCFMTGNHTPYTEETLLQMGAVRVFRKPFAFTEVIDTLNQLASRPPRCR